MPHSCRSGCLTFLLNKSDDPLHRPPASLLNLKASGHECIAKLMHCFTVHACLVPVALCSQSSVELPVATRFKTIWPRCVFPLLAAMGISKKPALQGDIAKKDRSHRGQILGSRTFGLRRQDLGSRKHAGKRDLVLRKDGPDLRQTCLQSILCSPAQEPLPEIHHLKPVKKDSRTANISGKEVGNNCVPGLQHRSRARRSSR